MKIGLYHEGPSGPLGIKVGEIRWGVSPHVGEKVLCDNTLWVVVEVTHVTDEIDTNEVVLRVAAIDGMEAWKDRDRRGVEHSRRRL